MKRTRTILLLVALAASVPLSVSLAPPAVRVAPALACSGTAYVATSPRAAWRAPVDAELPANGQIFVFQEKKEPYSWAPKTTNRYTFREAPEPAREPSSRGARGAEPLEREAPDAAAGSAITVTATAIWPGLLALEPHPPLAPGKRYALSWTDEGNVKPLITARVRPEEDLTAPTFENVGKFRQEEALQSSCGTLGPILRIPLRIRDESPVIVALWRGTTDEGTPQSFTSYDPSAPEVALVVDKLDGQPVTLVAIDAARHRSAPRVVLADLDAPVLSADRSGGSAAPRQRRGCGCGKF